MEMFEFLTTSPNEWVPDVTFPPEITVTPMELHYSWEYYPLDSAELEFDIVLGSHTVTARKVCVECWNGGCDRERHKDAMLREAMEKLWLQVHQSVVHQQYVYVIQYVRRWPAQSINKKYPIIEPRYVKTAPTYKAAQDHIRTILKVPMEFPEEIGEFQELYGWSDSVDQETGVEYEFILSVSTMALRD